MGRKYTTNTTGLKRQIIESLARNDLRISAVARELHYNQNTIKYHIVNIKRETGLLPIRFYDLIELLKTYPAASRRIRTPVRSCENCFHHRACLHLISPEGENLVVCDSFLYASNVSVVPLMLGGTVFDRKGTPYNIYKVEGGADPEDFEYSAWNEMLADAGERSHLYFCPGDVGINVFLDNPIGKASLDDSAAKDAVWGGESDE